MRRQEEAVEEEGSLWEVDVSCDVCAPRRGSQATKTSTILELPLGGVLLFIDEVKKVKYYFFSEFCFSKSKRKINFFEK